VKTTSRSNALRKNNQRRAEKVESQQESRYAEFLILMQVQVWPVPQSEANWLHVSPDFSPELQKLQRLAWSNPVTEVIPVPIDDWKWMRRTSFSGSNGSTWGPADQPSAGLAGVSNSRTNGGAWRRFCPAFHCISLHVDHFSDAPSGPMSCAESSILAEAERGPRICSCNFSRAYEAFSCHLQMALDYSSLTFGGMSLELAVPPLLNHPPPPCHPTLQELRADFATV
jgi:hypothetical protein